MHRAYTIMGPSGVVCGPPLGRLRDHWPPSTRRTDKSTGELRRRQAIVDPPPGCRRNRGTLSGRPRNRADGPDGRGRTSRPAAATRAYHLTAQTPGFLPYSGLVEIRSNRRAARIPPTLAAAETTSGHYSDTLSIRTASVPSSTPGRKRFGRPASTPRRDLVTS